MRIPTHIVIDTADGWTWARDKYNNPFTETTATAWANLLNSERKPAFRTFIVAAVLPVASAELAAAQARDAGPGRTAIGE